MEQRSIKFKAKRLDGKGWVEGDLQHNNDKVFITHGGYVVAEVAPSTICQYTGLKDKEGKEIWEGDYIRHKEGVNKYLIAFKRGSFVLLTDEYVITALSELCLSEWYVCGSKFDKEDKV